MAALAFTGSSVVTTSRMDSFAGTRSWKIRLDTSSYDGEAALEDRAEMVLPKRADFFPLGRAILELLDLGLDLDEMVEPNRDDLGVAAEVIGFSGMEVEVKSAQTSSTIFLVDGIVAVADATESVPEAELARVESVVEAFLNDCRASVMVSKIFLEREAAAGNLFGRALSI